MQKINFTKVGGTSVPAILGLSPFSGPFDEFNRLALGVRSELPEHAKERARWGQILENPVAREFISRHDSKNAAAWSQPESQEPDDPNWIRYSIDLQRPGALLEVKTTSAYSRDKWGKVGTDEIPIHYALQVHWYLFHERARLKKLNDPENPPPDVCFVAVLVGGQELLNYEIEANDQMGARIFAAVETWYKKHIIEKTPPPVDGSDGCRDFLEQLNPRRLAAEIRPAASEETTLVDDYFELKKQKEMIEKNLSKIENRLIESIGNHDGIEGDASGQKFRATYREPKASARVDWKKTAAELAEKLDPKLAAQIQTQNTKTTAPSARFQIRKLKQ
tara:strand:- start:242 stop:1243 length:1002 start_codon:yes stop_codon:yes gene_type:complete